MPKIALPLLFLFCYLSSFGQSSTNSAYNFGFELVDTSPLKPQGWFEWGSNYLHCLDSLTKHQGKYALRIEPDSSDKPIVFGSSAYKLPAQYVGKTIELRAYMKLQDVKGGYAGLLLRIDGEGRTLGFDNMQQRNISGTIDWQPYSIRLDLPENAETIYLGAILAGKGKIWIDDFELLIDGKALVKAPIKQVKTYPAQQDKEFDTGSSISISQLTAQKVEDLTLLAKVWGFLKYYHPAVAKGTYNWDYELFRMMGKVLESKTEQERNALLTQWVTGLGDVKQMQLTKMTDKEQVKLSADLQWLEDKTSLGEDLQKRLLLVKNAQRKKDHYYIGLAPNIGNPVFRNENSYRSFTYPDTGYRLLSLFRYWNMIQYYFPYKHLIKEDWHQVLAEFIPKMVAAENELAYKLATLELIARIHDTHANIWGQDAALASYKGNKYAPLEVTFVEEQALITDYFDAGLGQATGLKKGDKLISVNGETIEKIIKRKLALTPASNYATQLRDIARDMLRTNEQSLQVNFEREGKIQSTNVSCYSAEQAKIYSKYNQRDTCARLLKEDIGYIYPGSIKNAYLPKIMASFKDTKGLIIDLRCYPSEFIVFTLGEYLMPAAASFVKFTTGSIEQPGVFTFTKNLFVGKKNQDYYKGKVVILINETTQSQAEYTTMALRVVPGAKVIGSTTAAADGNVTQISLPGGINTMISGIGVYYPDGKETQRIGIVPDIEVKPTIKGVRAGKDEVLEKAIDLLSKGK